MRAVAGLVRGSADEPVQSATGADGSHEADRQDSEGAVQRSDADLKHEDDAHGTEEAT